MFKDKRFSEISILIHMAGFLTDECDLYGDRCSPFGEYPQYFGVGHSNTHIS